MKFTTLLLLLLLQAAFIAYGLALVFWTINEWLSGDGLNALFGGFLGGLVFFMTWRMLRNWVRRRFQFNQTPRAER